MGLLIMLGSIIGSVSSCRSSGCKFGSQPGHTAFVEIDHEVISMVIFPSSADQERQSSVTGGSMCTSTS